MRGLTDSAGVDAFDLGFALAKELKRLPFCLAGAVFPEGFEDACELAAKDVSDFGSSDLAVSAFGADTSLCNGRLAGTVDSVEGFGAFATGALADGAAAGGGRAPVLRWNNICVRT